jgi:hypothetical protein
VLFSNEEVARFINQNFEAAWESVRPVPLIQINFGGGTVLTRTLHGNIATYLCDARGQVLDILPGIYTPPVYLESLNQLRLLSRYLGRSYPQEDKMKLRTYHVAQAEALKRNQPPATLVEKRSPRPHISKLAIERPVEIVLAAAATGVSAHEADSQQVSNELKLDSPEDLANWKLLAEDTRINESTRRRQIHEMLASKSTVRPENVTKWLYREVLHADLDDPYLGLGNVLFASYPFKDRVQGERK